MLMMKSLRLSIALGFAWIVSTHAAECCTIPVFRYALDRWEADRFRLVVAAPTAARPEIVDLLRPLRAGGVANLDISTSKDAAVTETRLYAAKNGETPVWSGELNAPSLAALLDSPARKQILEHVLAGDSVTWVVVDDGTEHAERIAKRLSFLEQAAALPIQDPDDPDSQLGPGPELRLKFRVLHLKLSDAAEKPLFAMLAGPDGKVRPDQPLAAAVFARGRVLSAFPLDALDDATLEEACMFLIGRCSCRVKDQNPGWDVLMNVDWAKALEKAGAERKATASATAVKAETPKAAPEVSTITAEAAPPPPTPVVEGPWFLWGSVGGAIVVLLIAAIRRFV
jgi:hypothetical protein